MLEAKIDADNIIKELENSNSSKIANEKRKELNKKIENYSISKTVKPKKVLKKEDLKMENLNL